MAGDMCSVVQEIKREGNASGESTHRLQPMHLLRASRAGMIRQMRRTTGAHFSLWMQFAISLYVVGEGARGDG